MAVSRSAVSYSEQFAVVGEENVDGAIDQKPAELGAMPVDAKLVGERQRNLARVGVRDLRCLAQRFLGARRIPQIAFVVGDGGGRDDGLVDVLRAKLDASAEIGVHRPLAVGRDEDH